MLPSNNGKCKWLPHRVFWAQNLVGLVTVWMKIPGYTPARRRVAFGDLKKRPAEVIGHRSARCVIVEVVAIWGDSLTELE